MTLIWSQSCECSGFTSYSQLTLSYYPQTTDAYVVQIVEKFTAQKDRGDMGKAVLKGDWGWWMEDLDQD